MWKQAELEWIGHKPRNSGRHQSLVSWGRILPWESLEGTWSWEHVNSRHLTSRTVRDYISVVTSPLSLWEFVPAALGDSYGQEAGVRGNQRSWCMGSPDWGTRKVGGWMRSAWNSQPGGKATSSHLGRGMMTIERVEVTGPQWKDPWLPIKWMNPLQTPWDTSSTKQRGRRDPREAQGSPGAEGTPEPPQWLESGRQVSMRD